VNVFHLILSWPRLTAEPRQWLIKSSRNRGRIIERSIKYCDVSSPSIKLTQIILQSCSNGTASSQSCTSVGALSSLSKSGSLESKRLTRNVSATECRVSSAPYRFCARLSLRTTTTITHRELRDPTGYDSLGFARHRGIGSWRGLESRAQNIGAKGDAMQAIPPTESGR
jgi:hypothetical protein